MGRHKHAGRRPRGFVRGAALGTAAARRCDLGGSGGGWRRGFYARHVTAVPSRPPATVRTVEIDPPGRGPLDLLPEHGGLAWMSGGEGWSAGAMRPGWRSRGPDRVRRRDAWWRGLGWPASTSRTRSGCPAPARSRSARSRSTARPRTSVVVVPKVVVGRAGRTLVGDDDRRARTDDPLPRRVGAPARPARSGVRRRRAHPADWMAAVGRGGRPDRRRRARQGGAGPGPRRRAPTAGWTRAGRCSRLAAAYPAAGRSRSTACSARRRSCWCGARAGGSPRGCWPARSAAAATTARTARPGRSRVGARTWPSTRTPSVRRRGAGAALRALTCPDGAVRAAPAQRAAPGHRRHRPSVTDGVDLAGRWLAALHPSAAVCGTPTDGRAAVIARARGDGPRPLRRAGRLARRRRRRRVGHRAALRPGRPGRRRTRCGCSPGAASSPVPTRRPSWPRAQAKLVPMREALAPPEHPPGQVRLAVRTVRCRHLDAPRSPAACPAPSAAPPGSATVTCGVPVAAQSAARSTPCGVPNTRRKSRA